MRHLNIELRGTPLVGVDPLKRFDECTVHSRENLGALRVEYLARGERQTKRRCHRVSPAFISTS
jgi:hypothetical protein